MITMLEKEIKLFNDIDKSGAGRRLIIVNKSINNLFDYFIEQLGKFFSYQIS